MNLIRRPFRYSFFNATLILLVINLLVHCITMIFPVVRIYLGLSMAGMHHHFYWQPLTYMFVHGNWMHLIFNMIALLCFGMQIERRIGSKEFLLFYFVCGILDGVISIIVYALMGASTLLIGASGAIYALLLAFAVIFPRSIISIWGIIPVPAPILVAIYAIIEFGSQFVGRDNVAHFTHLSGLLLAWLYFLIRMGINPVRVWKEAYRR